MAFLLLPSLTNECFSLIVSDASVSFKSVPPVPVNPVVLLSYRRCFPDKAEREWHKCTNNSNNLCRPHPLFPAQTTAQFNVQFLKLMNLSRAERWVFKCSRCWCIFHSNESMCKLRRLQLRFSWIHWKASTFGIFLWTWILISGADRNASLKSKGHHQIFIGKFYPGCPWLTGCEAAMFVTCPKQN